MTRICVSLRAREVDELRRKALAAIDLGAELVELRLDHLSNPFDESLRRLVAELDGKAIITMRIAEEGGEYRGEEGRRLRFLSSLAEEKPAYIDLELKAIKGGGVDLERSKLLVSWHDYRGTPDEDVLVDIVDEMLSLGRIAKIVTYASKLEDNLRVLRLYERFEPSRLIAFSMGELGIVSRILSGRLGSPIAYTCLPGEALAPGQLDLMTFKELMRLCR